MVAEEEDHACPVELRLGTLFCGASQGSAGDCLRSQEGAGRLEVGGAIQGESTLGVVELPSSIMKVN